MHANSITFKFFNILIVMILSIGASLAQPANDDCSSPTILLASSDDSCNNITSGTTFSATQSNETTLCSAFSNDDDVWYVFTPNQTLEYFFEVSNTTTETYVNIYSGTCAGGLTTIGTYCFNSSNAAALTAGTSYMVQVYSLSHSEQTDFDLCAYPIDPPPSNDECSLPTVLLESSDDSCNNTISGTTFSATQSTETTLCSAFSNDDDVWYTFTPSLTNEYFFQVSNTTTETYVNIYSGTCSGGLNSIGTYCFNSFNSADLTIGTDYLIQVYSLSHSIQTDFDLCAYPNPNIPSNDDCSSPTTLLESTDNLCDNIISGSTINATQSDEIILCHTSVNDDDVWYTITPSLSYEYIFEVSNTSSYTYVNIYSGTCSGILTSIGAYCASATNSAGLTAGTSYMVQVYTQSQNLETDFELCAYPSFPLPSNDDCFSPTTLLESTDDSCNNMIIGTTMDATESSESNPCSGFFNDDDVWYTFTPSLSTTYFFELSNTTTLTYVNIYSGSCSAGFTNIGNDCHASNNLASLIAGTSYTIHIYTHDDNDETNFDLCAYPSLYPIMETVSCGTTLNQNHCYFNNDPATWVYTASDASQILKLEFLAGDIDNPDDEILIYDGTDATAPLLYAGGNGGDLTGLELFSTGPNLFFEINSNGILSCNSGTSCCPNPWEWELNCFSCFIAAGTAEVGTCDEIAQSVYIDVDITDLGDGTVIISNDGGVPSTTVNTTGVTTIGPFSFPDTITITLENPTDPSCHVVLPSLPILNCPLTNDNCSSPTILLESIYNSCNNIISGTTINATPGNDSILCSWSTNDDVWYLFTPSQNNEYYFELSNASVSARVNVYSGTCPVGLSHIGNSCSNSSTFASLTAGANYLIRVLTPSYSSPSDFDLCAYPSPFPLSETVNCGSTLSQNHCYDDNEIAKWLYTASDVSNNLKIEFLDGAIDNPDGIRIYDGIDASAPLLYGSSYVTSGLELFSTGPNLFFEFVSNGNRSCVSGWVSPPLEWEVECFDCSFGYGIAEVGTCDALSQTFMIDVDITDIGDGTIIVSNDGGVAPSTVSSTGLVSIGPFAFYDTITVSLEHPTIPLCNTILQEININYCPPPNDACANAIPLTVNPDLNCAITTPGTTVAATPSPQSLVNGNLENDVWYSFVATENVHLVRLDNIYGTSPNMSMVLYDGTSGCSGINYIFDSSYEESNLFSGLSAGTVYFLRIFSSGNNNAANFDICIGTPPPPPINDECINAIPLTNNTDYGCEIKTAGSNINATNSPYNNNGVYYSENHDVWFSFDATHTSHRIELSNVVSVSGLYGFRMRLYNATAGCSSLVHFPGTSLNSQTWPTTIGNSYVLRVYPYWDDAPTQGTFDVCLGIPVPPINDECSSSTVISESPNLLCANAVYGTTKAATESLASGLCNSNNDDDVWYEFIPTLSSNYVLELSNFNEAYPDMYVHIYSGTCATGLTNVGTCLSATSQTVSLTAGISYLVQVHNSSPNNYPTDFELCIYPLTCPSITNLMATNETETTIELSWIAGGTETTWDVEVVQAGNIPTGIPSFNDINTNPFTIPGLKHGTEYDIYVRADCGMNNAELSNTQIISTSTLCGTQNLTCGSDYNMNFYDSESFACWRIASGPISGPAGPPVGVTNWELSNYGNSGPNPSLHFGLFNSGDEDWAVGPDFDLSSGADFTLNFDIKLTAINTIMPSMMGSDDEVQLLISSDAGVNWTHLFTWDNTIPISYYGESVSIDLSSYTGLVKIGFWASTGANNDAPGADFFVDNFVLSCTIANCPDDYSGGGMPGSQPALSGLVDVDSDYETSGKIISTQLIGSIDSGITVDYDSGTEITLGAGFRTALGVEFSAFIDGCGGATIIGNDDNSLRSEGQDSFNSSSNNFGNELNMEQAYTDDFLFYLSSHNMKLSMIVKYLMEEEHISMKAILNESGF